MECVLCLLSPSIALTNRWVAFSLAAPANCLPSPPPSKLSRSISCLATSSESPWHNFSSWQQENRAVIRKDYFLLVQERWAQTLVWRVNTNNTVSLTSHCRYERAVLSLIVSRSVLNKARLVAWSSSASGDKSISDPVSERRKVHEI